MAESYLRLSDGTTWPNPVAVDDDADLAWMLTYAPERMTRAQQLRAASIIGSYAYLLLQTNRERRDQVCRDVRRALTTTDQPGRVSGDERGDQL